MKKLIGFTGTQQGMTEAQKAVVKHLLRNCLSFHHGDCIGADEQAHAYAPNEVVTIHPPLIEAKRAFCRAPRILPCKPYLDRNKDIVNSTEVLIATPSGFTEQLRSGTWSTIRYARKQRKRVVIIYPDGSKGE